MRAIDFGTSSTAAAHRGPGGTPELVTFGGAYAFPSTAAIDHGELICGEEAEALLPADPSAGTRAPKLILANDPHGICFLGGKEVEVVEVVAAILREAAVGDHASDDGMRVLTHPADWEPDGPRLQLLVEAAERAGLGKVCTISEPLAVAGHLEDRIPAGMRFCVFDLGGGTCDIAALERSGGFEVIARPRSEPIGGELVDALLFELVMEKLADQHAEEASHLRAAARARAEGSAHDGASTAELARWQGCLLGTERAIRAAKVRLSRDEEAVVRIPPPAHARLAISRSELSGRLRPSLERAADALSTVIAEAQLEPEATTVMLSGAASVMPVVREVLAERTGAQIEPVTPAKGAVPLGALRALQQAVAETPTLWPGWRGKPVRLELLEPIALPFWAKDACLGPHGELVIGGRKRVAVLSGNERLWKQQIESPSWANPDDSPEVLACAGDGTIAVGTREGQLLTIGPGGSPTRRLIEARYFADRPTVSAVLAWPYGNGEWIVGMKDARLLGFGPNGESLAFPAQLQEKVSTSPLSFAGTHWLSRFAVLTWSRLLILDENEAVTVVETETGGGRAYADVALGFDGVLAVSHVDGTIDLVSTGIDEHAAGTLLGTLAVEDGEQTEVRLLAEHVLAGSRTRFGYRLDVFERDGRLVTQAGLDKVEQGKFLFDRERETVWVVDSLKAHRFRLVSR